MRASDAPSSARARHTRGSRLRFLLVVLVVCTALLLGLHVRRAWVHRLPTSSLPGVPLKDSKLFSKLGLGSRAKEPEQEWDPDDPYRPLTTEEIKSFSMNDIQSMFDFIQSEVDFDKVAPSSDVKDDASSDRAARFSRLQAAMGQPDETDYSATEL